MTTMAHIRLQNFTQCDMSNQKEKEAMILAYAASTPVRVGGGSIVLKYDEQQDVVTQLNLMEMVQKSIKRPWTLDEFQAQTTASILPAFLLPSSNSLIVPISIRPTLQHATHYHHCSPCRGIDRRSLTSRGASRSSSRSRYLLQQRWMRSTRDVGGGYRLRAGCCRCLP
jgi:hypothetical protein